MTNTASGYGRLFYMILSTYMHTSCILCIFTFENQTNLVTLIKIIWSFHNSLLFFCHCSPSIFPGVCRIFAFPISIPYFPSSSHMVLVFLIWKCQLPEQHTKVRDQKFVTWKMESGNLGCIHHIVSVLKEVFLFVFFSFDFNSKDLEKSPPAVNSLPFLSLHSGYVNTSKSTSMLVKIEAGIIHFNRSSEVLF